MHRRPETLVSSTEPEISWPAPVATAVANRRSARRHQGGQPLPAPRVPVGAGDRLPGACGGPLGDGSLDGRYVDSAGGADTGTGSLGDAQTALPGAPRADVVQPATAGTPPASMTISANNPRVRTPSLPRCSGQQSTDHRPAMRSLAGATRLRNSSWTARRSPSTASPRMDPRRARWYLGGRSEDNAARTVFRATPTAERSP